MSTATLLSAQDTPSYFAATPIERAEAALAAEAE